MSTTRKGFLINDVYDPPPWSDTEVALFQDLVDGLVADAIGTTKDTDGHKHGNVYNSSKTTLLTCIGEAGAKVDISTTEMSQTIPHTIDYNSTNQLTLAYDNDAGSKCQFSVDADGYLTITPSGGKVTINDSLLVLDGGVSVQNQIQCIFDSSVGSIGVDSGGDMNVVNASGDVVLEAGGIGKIVLNSDLKINSSYTATPITNTGWIEIFDSSGTSRKVMVGE